MLCFKGWRWAILIFGEFDGFLWVRQEFTLNAAVGERKRGYVRMVPML